MRLFYRMEAAVSNRDSSHCQTVILFLYVQFLFACSHFSFWVLWISLHCFLQNSSSALLNALPELNVYFLDTLVLHVIVSTSFWQFGSSFFSGQIQLCIDFYSLSKLTFLIPSLHSVHLEWINQFSIPNITWKMVAVL